MEKRSREKIALVLLLVLLVAGICFMGWYIVKGHNWNYAAATIDDTVGSMDGYVVVLYDGSDISDRSPATGIGIISSNPSAGKDVTVGVKTDGSEKPSVVDINQEVESYRNKNANVFTLHTDVPGRYDNPSILYRDRYRIGVFSVNSDTPYLAIDKSISYLKSYSVDVIIALEDSENEYVRQVDGVDIIVELGTTPKEASSSSVRNGTKEYSVTSDKSTGFSEPSGKSSLGSVSASEEQESSNASSASDGPDSTSASISASSMSSTSSSSGEQSSKKKTNSAIVVSRCDRGSVGAILISPNNVVSTKVISPE